MTLNQLKNFITVAETCSFTKAAEINLIAQPAVSYSIKALEDELGGALFERSTRTVALTEAGKWFYAEAKELVRRMEEAKARVRALAAGGESLVIGYSSLANADLFLGAIDRFVLSHPAVSIQLARIDMTLSLYEAFRKGEIDLAYCFDIPDLRPADILVQKLGEANRYVIMSPNHRLADRAKIVTSELEDETILVFKKQFYRDQLLRDGVEPFANMHLLDTGDSESMEFLVSARLGIAVLPLSNAGKFQQTVKIPAYKEDGRTPEMSDLVLAWWMSNRSPNIRLFIDCCAKQ